MLGITLAMLGAVILVFADALKRHFGHRVSYKSVIWNTVLFGIVAGVIASVATGATVSDPMYLLWLPVSVVLLILGEVTFLKSMIHGEFSEVAPIRAVAPVFSLFLAIMFLGEIPSLLSVAGVVLVVVGVWVLSAPAGARTGPVFSAGVKYMIVSQFLGVLLGISIKAASHGVAPLIYFTLVMVGEWIYFSFAIMHGRIHPLALYKLDFPKAVLMSVLWGVGILAISIAPAYTLVAYAHASSQVYLPISLLVSGYLLKEANVIKRLRPSGVILGGVVLVILGAA